MVNLTIAGVDDRLATRLRRRATVHGRSLEAEALAILQHAAAAPEPDLDAQMAQWASASDALVTRFGAPGDEYAPF
jgi:plasmid stability protein